MTATPPLRDRVAFGLLVPSLAVPIAAIALAAWRAGHVDDGQVHMHLGYRPFYFGAMITLTATLFSMTINAVLAVRGFASLSLRAMSLARLAPHFVVTLVVAVWAVEFCVFRLAMEGLAFGIILVVGSVFSYVVISSEQLVQYRVEVADLTTNAKWALTAYPVGVVLALSVAVVGWLSQNELLLVGVAILAFLGLPWSGVTALFWLPLSGIFHGLASMAFIFLILAALPAIANAVLAVVFLRSTPRRTTFINDFLEAAPSVEADSNTLGA